MRKIVALLFLVFPLTLWAQIGSNGCHNAGSNETMCTNYTGSPTLTTNDNLPNAMVRNVWHAMPSAPSGITGFSSGFDSTGGMVHYAVASGQVWEYRDYWNATTSYRNTWYHHTEMGSSVINIAAGSGGALYSFQTIPQCTGGSYGIFKWTGSAWTQPSPGACGIHLSVSSADATLAVVGGDHWIYTSSNGGVSYTQISGALAVWKYATIQDATNLIGVTTSTGVWNVALPNGTVTNLAGNTNAPAAITPSGKVLAIGTDSFSYIFTGTGWNKLFGNGLVAINSCGPMCTFVLNTAGSIFHFPDLSYTIDAPLYGNTTCYDGMGAQKPCPTGITHAGTSTVQWAGGSLGGQTITTQPHTPETIINIDAQDTTYDPFICYDSNYQDCFTTPTGSSVNCSFVGAIFTASFVGSLFESEMSITRLKWDGNKTGTGCFTHGPLHSNWCVYNTQSWCTQSTNPPDDTQTKLAELKSLVDNSGNGQSLFGWDRQALCGRFSILGFHTAWSCADSTKPDLVGLGLLYYLGPLGTDPIACTHNP